MSKKNQQLSLKIAIIISSLLFLVSGGCSLKNQKVETPEETKNINVISTTPAWQDLKNETYGYSLKYPSDWTLEYITNEGDTIAIYKEKFKNSIQRFNFGISVLPNSNGITAEEYAKQVEEEYIRAHGELRSKSKESIKLNEYNAVVIKELFEIENNEDEYFITTAKFMYKIGINSQNNPEEIIFDPQKNYEIALKILETFRLLDN